MDILGIAQRAAREAGDFIRDAAKDISRLTIEQKRLHDYVSEVDRTAEEMIVARVQGVFPEHRILGEEYGEQGRPEADYQWVIDPLDGTTNFLRSIPHYAVSIGVLHNQQLEHAVVFDAAKGEMFYASRDKGAFLDDRQLVVSQRNDISGALLATGVPYSGDNLIKIASFTDTMVGLLEQNTSGIRRMGAAALDLAYVAAGRYDGFWESNLKPWDIAAGALLVMESGGIVSDLRGGDSYLVSGHILAASEVVHRDMLRVTSQYY